MRKFGSFNSYNLSQRAEIQFWVYMEQLINLFEFIQDVRVIIERKYTIVFQVRIEVKFGVKIIVKEVARPIIYQYYVTHRCALCDPVSLSAIYQCCLRPCDTYFKIVF